MNEIYYILMLKWMTLLNFSQRQSDNIFVNFDENEYKSGFHIHVLVQHDNEDILQ